MNLLGGAVPAGEQVEPAALNLGQGGNGFFTRILRFLVLLRYHCRLLALEEAGRLLGGNVAERRVVTRLRGVAPSRGVAPTRVVGDKVRWTILRFVLVKLVLPLLHEVRVATFGPNRFRCLLSLHHFWIIRQLIV